MNATSFIDRLETLIFRPRLFVIFTFLLATFFLAYKASQIKLDAAFTKNIPLNHEYMQTYLKHRANFGGANNILISVCHKKVALLGHPLLTPKMIGNAGVRAFLISRASRTCSHCVTPSSSRT